MMTRQSQQPITAIAVLHAIFLVSVEAQPSLPLPPLCSSFSKKKACADVNKRPAGDRETFLSYDGPDCADGWNGCSPNSTESQWPLLKGYKVCPLKMGSSLLCARHCTDAPPTASPQVCYGVYRSSMLISIRATCPTLIQRQAILAAFGEKMM